MNVRLVIGHKVLACTSLQDVLNTKAHHFIMVEASLRMVPMQYNLPQGKKTCGRFWVKQGGAGCICDRMAIFQTQ